MVEHLPHEPRTPPDAGGPTPEKLEQLDLLQELRGVHDKYRVQGKHLVADYDPDDAARVREIEARLEVNPPHE